MRRSRRRRPTTLVTRCSIWLLGRSRRRAVSRPVSDPTTTVSPSVHPVRPVFRLVFSTVESIRDFFASLAEVRADGAPPRIRPDRLVGCMHSCTCSVGFFGHTRIIATAYWTIPVEIVRCQCLAGVPEGDPIDFFDRCKVNRRIECLAKTTFLSIPSTRFWRV